VQVQASFIDGVLICPESSLDQVNSIISTTENQLAPIESRHDQCTDEAETQSTNCISGCIDIGCLLNCEQLTADLFDACDDPYNAEKNPIVFNAQTQLESYCTLLD